MLRASVGCAWLGEVGGDDDAAGGEEGEGSAGKVHLADDRMVGLPVSIGDRPPDAPMRSLTRRKRASRLPSPR